MRRYTRSQPHRAFSLTEVLLAVFILAIGIISIAALFPAGIAQQRLSTDDSMGPIVAKHAMSVIRSKVKPGDFGSFDSFYASMYNNGLTPVHPNNVPTAFFTRTRAGDWGWMRPGFILGEDGDVPPNLHGAVDIFSHFYTRDWFNDLPNEPDLSNATLATEIIDGWPQIDDTDEHLFGIPYDTNRYGMANFNGEPPRRVITQRERFYPMQHTIPAASAAGDPPATDRSRPEYVWECMFRRFQGKVYVAIFVYRVTSNDASSADWRVPMNQSNNFVPPLPIGIDLGQLANDPEIPYSQGPWDVAYRGTPARPAPFVPGIDNANDLDLLDHRQAWQEHRQWLLDQNNYIYRIVARQIDTDDNSIELELTRPLRPVSFAPIRNDGQPGSNDPRGRDTTDDHPNMPQGFPDTLWNSGAPGEYYADPLDGTAYPGGFETPAPSFFNWRTSVDRGVVTRFWYVPRFILDEFGNEWQLTPVYVSVKEL